MFAVVCAEFMSSVFYRIRLGTLAIPKNIVKQIYGVFRQLCCCTVGVVAQALQSSIYCIKAAGCFPLIPPGDGVTEQQMCKMGGKA